MLLSKPSLAFGACSLDCLANPFLRFLCFLRSSQKASAAISNNKLQLLPSISGNPENCCSVTNWWFWCKIGCWRVSTWNTTKAEFEKHLVLELEVFDSTTQYPLHSIHVHSILQSPRHSSSVFRLSLHVASRRHRWSPCSPIEWTQMGTGSPPGIPLAEGSCKSPCARKKKRYIRAWNSESTEIG